MPNPVIRRTLAAATLVVTGLGVSACARSTPGAVESPSTGVDVRPFVECMRSHDLPDFPEVTVSADGLVNFDIRGERVDTDSKVYGAALRACQSLLPSGARLPGAPDAPPAPDAP